MKSGWAVCGFACGLPLVRSEVISVVQEQLDDGEWKGLMKSRGDW